MSGSSIATLWSWPFTLRLTSLIVASHSCAATCHKVATRQSFADLWTYARRAACSMPQPAKSSNFPASTDMPPLPNAHSSATVGDHSAVMEPMAGFPTAAHYIDGLVTHRRRYLSTGQTGARGRNN